MERKGEGRRGLGIGFDGGGCIFFFFPNLLCVYVANWYEAGCPSMVDEEISIYSGKKLELGYLDEALLWI